VEAILTTPRFALINFELNRTKFLRRGNVPIANLHPTNTVWVNRLMLSINNNNSAFLLSALDLANYLENLHGRRLMTIFMDRMLVELP